MLYACDGHWWRMRKGAPEFGGLKLTQDTQTCVQYIDVHKVEVVEKCDRILVDTPGRIAAGGRDGGGNSGFQALNLAVQFGARRIVLVGFDMRDDHGVHWHGSHPKGLNNPKVKNFMSWRRPLDDAAPLLAALGVEAWNASPISALSAYPFCQIEDVL